VRAGGVLSCASALTVHGVWMRHEPRLHVAVDHAANHSTGTAIVKHWARRSRPLGFVETPFTAFSRFAKCGEPLDIVIAADSLLNRRLLTSEQVETILSRTARGRRLLGRVDGKAESGTETIVRSRLRADGIRLRSQVSIAGVGRVDFVVGGRLVIEVDSREWHDEPSQFERDRARDALLVARGYLVMRFSYRRVMDEIAEIEKEILAVVRTRDHVRRPRHDRMARNCG
jgi:very-short-patch-repair endonuclease